MPTPNPTDSAEFWTGVKAVLYPLIAAALSYMVAKIKLRMDDVPKLSDLAARLEERVKRLEEWKERRDD